MFMLTSIKVGIYLAIKDLSRASKLTTLLIVFIMTLTFLNLTVGRGILVGLPKGSTNVYDERYSGDLIISKLRKDQYIVDSNELERFYTELSGIKYVTKRYLHPATITAGYEDRIRDSEVYDSTGSVIVGVDYEAENNVTGISRFVVEGRYPENSDTRGVLIGANLLFRYSPLDSPTESNIKNLKVGDKVKITVNGIDHFYFVRGVVKSKVSEVDRRIYLPYSEFKVVSGERDFKPEEISFKLESGVSADNIKNKFYEQGLHKLAKIQTAEESQPQFLKDIGTTFDILGNFLGAIGLVVASVTVFIVIFVNAITRRKFIGILKAIGISSAAIQISYIIQAVFYATVGSLIGMLILYSFFEPYFLQNPINFPFADGILYAPFFDSLFRFGVLVLASVLSGFIPARMVVKQKTLDAILGR
jgi:ABC-type lipoprotein release transport system permease subunit